jgi:hypothetical protein
MALYGNCIVSSVRGPVGIVAFPECGILLNGLVLVGVVVSLLTNGRWFWRSREDYVVMVQVVLSGPRWRRGVVGMMAMASGPVFFP